MASTSPLRIKIITVETIPSTLTMDQIAPRLVADKVVCHIKYSEGWRHVRGDFRSFSIYMDKFQESSIHSTPPWTQTTLDLTQD
jgi:hypothetical protein